MTIARQRPTAHMICRASRLCGVTTPLEAYVISLLMTCHMDARNRFVNGHPSASDGARRHYDRSTTTPGTGACRSGRGRCAAHAVPTRTRNADPHVRCVVRLGRGAHHDQCGDWY